LKGACGDFSYYFDKYFRSWGDAVVLGHTHIPDAQFKTDSSAQNDIAYVNSGCWVNAGSMTYVEVDYDYKTIHPTFLSVIEVTNPSLNTKEVIDQIWLYSPSLDLLSKYTYNSLVGTKYSFRCGPILVCPVNIIDCYTNSAKFNMVLLAIVSKAGILDVSVTPISGGIAYGSNYYAVTNGQGILSWDTSKNVFNYTAPADAPSIMELAQWYSSQDPNVVIPQQSFSSQFCSGVLANTVNLLLVFVFVVVFLIFT